MTRELFEHFNREFWKSAGVMTFSAVSMRHFADSLDWGEVPVGTDPQVILSKQAPNDPGAQMDASWRRSEIESAAAPQGWLQEWLTDAWIALIFARWERHYRPEFAARNGVTQEQVVCEVMGDIRHLRNDVIHHGGIATQANTGRCKQISRFTPGDRIVLTPEDVRLLQSKLAVTVASQP